MLDYETLMNSTTKDSTMSMNLLGRLYARDNNLEALEIAGLNLSTAVSEKEAQSMQWWWNEGIRDYARNQGHVEDLNQDLLTKHDEILHNNS